MTKQQLFDMLLQQYLVINENRDTLIAEAQTFEQGEQIMNAWRQANLNQLTLGNKILIDDTPALEHLAQQVAEATASVQQSLLQLQQQVGNIDLLASTVSSIGAAVALGTRLVAMA